MERTNVSCDFGKKKRVGEGGGDKEKDVEIAS